MKVFLLIFSYIKATFLNATRRYFRLLKRKYRNDITQPTLNQRWLNHKISKKINANLNYARCSNSIFVLLNLFAYFNSWIMYNSDWRILEWNLTQIVVLLVGTKYTSWFSTPKSYKSLNLLTVTSCKVLKKQPFPLRLNTTFISLHMIHKVFLVL